MAESPSPRQLTKYHTRTYIIVHGLIVQNHTARHTAPCALLFIKPQPRRFLWVSPCDIATVLTNGHGDAKGASASIRYPSRPILETYSLRRDATRAADSMTLHLLASSVYSIKAFLNMFCTNQTHCPLRHFLPAPPCTT